MKLFGLTETKLFHFHRIFKNRTQGGGFNPLWTRHCIYDWILFLMRNNAKLSELVFILNTTNTLQTHNFWICRITKNITVSVQFAKDAPIYVLFERKYQCRGVLLKVGTVPGSLSYPQPGSAAAFILSACAQLIWGLYYTGVSTFIHNSFIT